MEIGKTLFTKEELRIRVAELGEEISAYYKDKDLVLIVVLNGAMIFFADLVRKIKLGLGSIRVNTIAVSSYETGTETSGMVKIKKDIDSNIKGRNVLLVEDIIDTGLTLSFIIEYLGKQEPASLRSCVLLNKVERREVKVDLDYVGFEISNEFVVGYGLDCAEEYRNLPDVVALKQELYPSRTSLKPRRKTLS
ncbi:MAG: hypoxanthine phosphoribosyltransferase [Patescibacteria group bacterium]|nr:hypoxanthine phosphoribosyltransferase [Patescibacteria group bacterium]